MSIETILTDEQIIRILEENRPEYDGLDKAIIVSRAIEQAVLQSPEIQALRRENIRLFRLIKEMADHGTYETEYDGRMYSICHGCGAQDGENHRDPDCIYVRASAAMENQNEDS